MGDRRKLYDENNQLRDLKDMDEDTAKMIAEIETKQVGPDGDITVTKVKTYDKLAAIEKLYKQLGLYEKDNEQKRTNFMLLTDDQLQAAASASAEVLGNAGGDK